MSASSTVWQGAGRRIHMQEVGTRDGLQMEQAFVPTEEKIALVNALSNAGLSKIEVTSFTSPTAIPALRDAEIVMREITRLPGTVYTALVPMSIWGACGFNMLLFLAAMESIPQSLYEAADLDGASAFRQFWTITLPLIWDVLSIAIVFMVIGGMKAFEVIWLFTNQRPVTEVHVVGTLMVQDMFTEYKVGEATAIAVLLFLMVFFGTAATLRLMRRESVEY